MKNIAKFALAGVIIGALSVIGGAAQAGSVGSTNTYINGHESGTRKVRVNTTAKESGYRIVNGETLKFETNFPNANGYIYGGNGNLYGGINVSTRGVDPFVVGSTTSLYEYTGFNAVTDISVSEDLYIQNDIYTHTVESFGN